MAYLLLEAKCEVNLVADLSVLDKDSTGLLCLEGIKGDMALLSWNDAEQAHAILESHGIQGRLGGSRNAPKNAPLTSEELGPGVYNAMQRSVHHLQLDLQYTGEYYEEQIKRLARDAAVKTVSLGGPPAPSSSGSVDNSQPGSQQPVATPVIPDSSAPSVAPVPKRSALYQEADADESDLDALIDRLDESDL